MSIPSFIEYRLGEVSATLEKYGYPRSGLVDSSLISEEVSQYFWLLDGAKGFYVFDGRLQYHYVDKVEETFTLTTGVNNITLTGVANPNKGPVLIYSDTTGAGGSGQIQYLPHSNCFYPGYHGTWSTSGAYYRMQVPSGTLLVNVRSLEEDCLLKVGTLGDVLTVEQYYYDEVTGYVYIKPTSSPTNKFFLDILYDEPLIKYREVVVMEKDGLRPTYKYIEDIDIIKETTENYNSGAAFFGDYIEPAVSYEEGEWVVLEYYIKYSYVIKSTTEIDIYAGYASTDEIIISYETTYDQQGLDSGTCLNLSPLTSGYKAQGYIVSTETPISTLNTPAKVVALSDKTLLHTGVAEETLITVIVLDESNVPVPFATISKTSTNLSAISSFPTAVDSTGKISFYVKATAAGAWNIFFTCSAINSNTISGTASSSLYDTADYNKGFSFVDFKEDSVYCQQSRLDGLPRLGYNVVLNSGDTQTLMYKSKAYKGDIEMEDSTIIAPYYNSPCLSERGVGLFAIDSDKEGLYDLY